jgi:hypothetical protein
MRSLVEHLKEFISRRFVIAGAGLFVIYHDPSAAFYVSIIVTMIAGSNATEKIFASYFNSPNKPSVPMISINQPHQPPTTQSHPTILSNDDK